MFMERIKAWFSRINPVKRLFVQNIYLGWVVFIVSLLFLLAAMIDGHFLLIAVLLAFLSHCANLIFLRMIFKTKLAYQYYLFVATGGFLALVCPITVSLELIGWNIVNLGIFWTLVFGSIILLLISYIKRMDNTFISSGLLHSSGQAPEQNWDIDLGIDAHLNIKYERITNFLKYFVAPFMPALGMALSRILDGKQEVLIGGFLLLILALVLTPRYVMFYSLSLKLFLQVPQLRIKE